MKVRAGEATVTSVVVCRLLLFLHPVNRRVNERKGASGFSLSPPVAATQHNILADEMHSPEFSGNIDSTALLAVVEE